MIHPGQLTLLKRQGCRWLATFLSLWLAVAYLWLALFYPLMCAPYRAANTTTFDTTTAFEHTVTPFSVVASTSIDWSRFVMPEITDAPAWMADAQSTVTGLALTFISLLFKPLWAWLAWVKPLLSVSLLLGERPKQRYLAPPKRPPRFAFA